MREPNLDELVRIWEDAVDRGEELRPADLCQSCPELLEALEDRIDLIKRRTAVGEMSTLPPPDVSTPRAISAPTAPLISAFVPGHRLGDYEVLERLQAGGMGLVCKAKHVHLGKIVALKVMSDRLAANEEARARFRREVLVLGAVSHPNVVEASDAREENGILFLVMEFVNGFDFEKIVGRCGPLPYQVACELVRQAALGLEHVHNHGVIHRDIKPSNLIASLGGPVKIVDLGLAIFRDHESLAEELTLSGQVMGTADYMAPEQWLSARDVDARCDVYSLGCTLFKLLSGEAPYSGNRFDTLAKKTIAHLELPLPDIRELRKDLPHALSRLLEQMVAKDKEARPGAGHVARTLAPLSDGQALADLLNTIEARPSAPQTSPSTRSRAQERSLSGTATAVSVANRKFGRRIAVVATMLLALTWISLTAAYYGVATEAWTRKFDRLGGQSPMGTGFLIEGARSLVFVTLAVTLIGFRFGSEARELFDIRRGDLPTNVFRVLAAALVVFYACGQCVHHLSTAESYGPAQLAAWAQQEMRIETTATEELRPYAAYLPYSLINYMGAACLTFIPAFAGFGALSALIRAWRDLKFDVTTLISVSEIKDSFKKFRRLCDRSCLRTLDVFAVLALSIQFEYWLGKKTLTAAAFERLITGQVILGFVLVLYLACVWLLYWSGFDFTRDALANKVDDDFYRWCGIHGAMAFARSILANNVSGVVVTATLFLPIVQRLTG